VYATVVEFARKCLKEMSLAGRQPVDCFAGGEAKFVVTCCI